MSLIWILLAELLAITYFLVPVLAGAVALRGLLWLGPLRIFWLQRILFHVTEPAVKHVRENFGIRPVNWDPSFALTIFILLALWATVIRSGLDFTLSLLVHGF